MNVGRNEYRHPADVHNLLGNRRRLLVIGYLSLFEPETTVAVRHIARVVRGIETGTPPTQVSTSDYESAYNGLIQTHLPKLAANDLLKYNEQRKTVLVTPQLEQYVAIAATTRFVISVM